MALAVLVLSLALLLKGQAEVSVRSPRVAQGFQELPWLWICGSILIVVLCWEGVKWFARVIERRCSRVCAAMSSAISPPSLPCEQVPLPFPSGSQEQPQSCVVECPQPAHTSSTLARIPGNLEAFFTATGERWHQDPNCADVRSRIAKRFLPCGRCTADQVLTQPPAVPQPLPQHNPPPPPIRRRRQRG